MATLAAVNTVSPFDVDTTFADGFTSTLLSAVTSTTTADVSAQIGLPFLGLNSKGKLVVVCTAITGTNIVPTWFESPDGVNYSATASALTATSVTATGTTAMAAVATGGILSTGRIGFTGTYTTATFSVYLYVWNR